MAKRNRQEHALADEQIKTLRKMYMDGATPHEIARLLGVHVSTAYKYTEDLRRHNPTDGLKPVHITNLMLNWRRPVV